MRRLGGRRVIEIRPHRLLAAPAFAWSPKTETDFSGAIQPKADEAAYRVTKRDVNKFRPALARRP
jgi:hypothetical protein